MKISHAFSYVPKSPLVAFFGFFTALAVTAGAFAAFGPDRPTLTYDGAGTPGADYVVFNSFTNNPNWGDERDFARGVVAGRDSSWTDPLNDVEPGQTVRMIMFVHNNADPKYNASGEGVAKDTTVAVDVPTGVASAHDLTGTISASNAQPTSVYDTLSLNGAEEFGLDFVEGSAKIVGNDIDAPLSDDIVNGGVTIGDDQLDGLMNGCFEYSVYVMLDFQLTAEPEYEINKSVREKDSGPGNWAEGVNLDEGDVAEWEIRFENSGRTLLEDVAIVDEVPAGLTVVPGSIELINSQYPDGVTIPDDAIQANGRQVNVLAGDHNPTGVSYLYFYTTVDDIDGCEVTKKFVNKAFATPKDLGAIWADAHVEVTTEDCEEPKEEFNYACEALNVSILDQAERRVRAEAVISNSDNVSVVGTEIDFGDNTAVVTDNPATHTYAAIGTYTITATIGFQLDNDAKEVKEVTCSNKVEFGETEGEVTPPTEPELPNTGAGLAAFSLFGATSAAAAAYGYIRDRRSV